MITLVVVGLLKTTAVSCNLEKGTAKSNPTEQTTIILNYKLRSNRVPKLYVFAITYNAFTKI